LNRMRSEQGIALVDEIEYRANDQRHAQRARGHPLSEAISNDARPASHPETSAAGVWPGSIARVPGQRLLVHQATRAYGWTRAKLGRWAAIPLRLIAGYGFMAQRTIGKIVVFIWT
jgi:hypothetical protein